jgi:hypothetical protein
LFMCVFGETFLMAYSKANVKTMIVSISLFQTIFSTNCTTQMFTSTVLLQVSCIPS